MDMTTPSDVALPALAPSSPDDPGTGQMRTRASHLGKPHSQHSKVLTPYPAPTLKFPPPGRGLSREEGLARLLVLYGPDLDPTRVSLLRPYPGAPFTGVGPINPVPKGDAEDLDNGPRLTQTGQHVGQLDRPDGTPSVHRVKTPPSGLLARILGLGRRLLAIGHDSPGEEEPPRILDDDGPDPDQKHSSDDHSFRHVHHSIGNSIHQPTRHGDAYSVEHWQQTHDVVHNLSDPGWVSPVIVDHW